VSSTFYHCYWYGQQDNKENAEDHFRATQEDVLLLHTSRKRLMTTATVAPSSCSQMTLNSLAETELEKGTSLVDSMVPVRNHNPTRRWESICVQQRPNSVKMRAGVVRRHKSGRVLIGGIQRKLSRALSAGRNHSNTVVSSSLSEIGNVGKEDRGSVGSSHDSIPSLDQRSPEGQRQRSNEAVELSVPH